MIDVDGLQKRYGDLVAVDGISFTARPGRIFGLLGPNGAGKSTTISCIAGLVAPSAGRVRVLEHDVVTDGSRSRERLGVVPQELALYEELSARENLSYWGAAYGLRGGALSKRVDEVLSTVGLLDRAREPVKRFSGGMKRRLNFAAGVVHAPDVLLLDEPTVGVDPQSRVRLLDLVRHEALRGTTVLYTTHYMEEAQQLCDDLAIIDGGKVVAKGTLFELRAELGERDLLRLSGRFTPGVVNLRLRAMPGVEVIAVGHDTITLAVEQATKHLPAIFSALAEVGADVRETTLTEPSLESLFIKLTGKELRE